MNNKVGRSRTGLPIITENGGGATNTGSAVIICGARGEKIKPLFVPKGYSQGEHTIFVAKVGMHVVESNHDRSGEHITVYRIDGIGLPSDPDAIQYCEVYRYENGDGNVPAEFEAAVQAAHDKGHCRHCRCVHFAFAEVN